MIFILALDLVHAHNVAIGAGLEPHEWKLLDWHRQLMGTYKPNVVVLQAAEQIPHYLILLDEMEKRSAVVWTELDLIRGRVPR